MEEITGKFGTVRIVGLSAILDAMLDGDTLKRFGPFRYCARVAPSDYERSRWIQLTDDHCEFGTLKVGGSEYNNKHEWCMLSDFSVHMDEVMLFDEKAKATFEKFCPNLIEHLTTVKMKGGRRYGK